jgi:hypothetical protein
MNELDFNDFAYWLVFHNIKVERGKPMLYIYHLVGHEEEALAIAEALNMNGSNVIVFKELAYCNYIEEMI